MVVKSDLHYSFIDGGPLEDSLSKALPAGFGAPLAGCEALPACSEALPAGSKAHPA